MRGYGVKCWSFWQDLSQLQRIYPRDWQSLVNNCAVQQYFGAMAPQAVAELEGYLGPSVHRLLARMKPEHALLIRRGLPAELVKRPDYLRDPVFEGIFAPNPFYHSNFGDDLEEVKPPPPDYDNVVRFPEQGER